jgi:hypothetical protein
MKANVTPEGADEEHEGSNANHFSQTGHGNFLSIHQDEIVGTLTMFDRMIFRGYLTGFFPKGAFGAYLSRQGILLKDFSNFGYSHNRWLVIESRSIWRVFFHMCADSHDVAESMQAFREAGLHSPSIFPSPTCAGYLVHPSDFLDFWQKFCQANSPFPPTVGSIYFVNKHWGSFLGKHTKHKQPNTIHPCSFTSWGGIFFPMGDALL